MAVPKIIGSETEFGLTVQNDRDFDSIATSLLLVNSYNADQSLRLLWDYDQEEPLVDARGFEHDETCEVPDQQDNMALNKILNNGARFYVGPRAPGVFDAGVLERPWTCCATRRRASAS